MHHLDTDVVVDFLRGEERAAKRISELGGNIAISTPVLAELYFGAEASTRRTERIQEIERLLEHVGLVAFNSPAAAAYGRIRNQLRGTGRPIGEMDTLIAAIAMANQVTLATRNVKHFGRIKGLRVENWS